MERRMMVLPPAAKTREPEASWSSWPAGAPRRRGSPDPELVEQARRRSFTAKYKLEILAKADACTAPGEVGELLRCCATRAAYALDPGELARVTPQGSILADAVEALGIAVRAWALRFGSQHPGEWERAAVRRIAEPQLLR
jgi:hypothetical protein